MRVYAYNRVSTKEQHLDRGASSVKEFCKQHGYELSSIITGLNEAVDYEKGKISAKKQLLE